MGGKKGVDKHTTFMFKTSIKESFQDACFESGYSMTEVLEMMMVNFIATVKNKKDGKEKKD